MTPLEKTLRLLGLVALDGRNQREKVRLLNKAGFERSEIADLVGSTPNAIGVRLDEIRKEGRNRKKTDE